MRCWLEAKAFLVFGLYKTFWGYWGLAIFGIKLLLYIALGLVRGIEGFMFLVNVSRRLLFREHRNYMP
jgi:hypothetical protein